MPARPLNLISHIGKTGPLCTLDKTGTKQQGEDQNDESQYAPITERDRGEPVITADNIEVAQFTYLLLCNRAICNVIDAIPSIEL